MELNPFKWFKKKSENKPEDEEREDLDDEEEEAKSLKLSRDDKKEIKKSLEQKKRTIDIGALCPEGVDQGAIKEHIDNWTEAQKGLQKFSETGVSEEFAGQVVHCQNEIRKLLGNSPEAEIILANITIDIEQKLHAGTLDQAIYNTYAKLGEINVFNNILKGKTPEWIEKTLPTLSKMAAKSVNVRAGLSAAVVFGGGVVGSSALPVFLGMGVGAAAGWYGARSISRIVAEKKFNKTMEKIASLGEKGGVELSRLSKEEQKEWAKLDKKMGQKKEPDSDDLRRYTQLKRKIYVQGVDKLTDNEIKSYAQELLKGALRFGKVIGLDEHGHVDSSSLPAYVLMRYDRILKQEARVDKVDEAFFKSEGEEFLELNTKYPPLDEIRTRNFTFRDAERQQAPYKKLQLFKLQYANELAKPEYSALNDGILELESKLSHILQVGGIDHSAPSETFIKRIEEVSRWIEDIKKDFIADLDHRIEDKRSEALIGLFDSLRSDQFKEKWHGALGFFGGGALSGFMRVATMVGLHGQTWSEAWQHYSLSHGSGGTEVASSRVSHEFPKGDESVGKELSELTRLLNESENIIPKKGVGGVIVQNNARVEAFGGLAKPSAGMTGVYFSVDWIKAHHPQYEEWLKENESGINQGIVKPITIAGSFPEHPLKVALDSNGNGSVVIEPTRPATSSVPESAAQSGGKGAPTNTSSGGETSAQNTGAKESTGSTGKSEQAAGTGGKKVPTGEHKTGAPETKPAHGGHKGRSGADKAEPAEGEKPASKPGAAPKPATVDTHKAHGAGHKHIPVSKPEAHQGGHKGTVHHETSKESAGELISANMGSLPEDHAMLKFLGQQFSPEFEKNLASGSAGGSERGALLNILYNLKAHNLIHMKGGSVVIDKNAHLGHWYENAHKVDHSTADASSHKILNKHWKDWFGGKEHPVKVHGGHHEHQPATRPLATPPKNLPVEPASGSTTAYVPPEIPPLRGHDIGTAQQQLMEEHANNAMRRAGVTSAASDSVPATVSAPATADAHVVAQKPELPQPEATKSAVPEAAEAGKVRVKIRDITPTQDATKSEVVLPKLSAEEIAKQAFKHTQDILHDKYGINPLLVDYTHSVKVSYFLEKMHEVDLGKTTPKDVWGMGADNYSVKEYAKLEKYVVDHVPNKAEKDMSLKDYLLSKEK